MVMGKELQGGLAVINLTAHTTRNEENERIYTERTRNALAADLIAQLKVITEKFGHHDSKIILLTGYEQGNGDPSGAYASQIESSCKLAKKINGVVELAINRMSKANTSLSIQHDNSVPLQFGFYDQAYRLHQDIADDVKNFEELYVAIDASFCTKHTSAYHIASSLIDATKSQIDATKSQLEDGVPIHKSEHMHAKDILISSLNTYTQARLNNKSQYMGVGCFKLGFSKKVKLEAASGLLMLLQGRTHEQVAAKLLAEVNMSKEKRGNGKTKQSLIAALSQSGSNLYNAIIAADDFVKSASKEKPENVIERLIKSLQPERDSLPVASAGCPISGGIIR